ncbi:uncharacterized protein LOC109811206 [Cajanus cajan]|uniref:uncharacterized protein LOC109811206 n=1 Tax=Cajanus cajan TaxID=3821 RepID=UPI00098DA271|nr:uncharacterized protein LOC109811206 [Cajanus cajan]
MSRAFWGEGVSADSLVRPEGFSEQGRELLSQMDATSKWKYYCELQSRSLALVNQLAMGPIGELVQMRQRLEEADRAVAEARATTQGALATNRQLAAELDVQRRNNDTLRLDLQKAENEGKRLAEEAQAELERVKESAKDQIVAQHEARFRHAIRQAKYIGHFREDLEFDMTKDFYQGSFMSFAEMPAGAMPDSDEPDDTPEGEEAQGASDDEAEDDQEGPTHEQEDEPETQEDAPTHPDE